MAPLSTLINGDKAKIVEIDLKGDELYNSLEKIDNLGERIEDIGIRVGKVVEVLKNQSSGPILLKVDNSRIALGRNMADDILVNKLS